MGARAKVRSDAVKKLMDFLDDLKIESFAIDKSTAYKREGK